MVGFDQRIGPGACAICRIYPGQAADRPLFSSGLLHSGQDPIPVGPLPLDPIIRPGGAGRAGPELSRKLVLATEWAGDDRPHVVPGLPGQSRQGGDVAFPLDIGGHVDWLMPFVNVEIDDASYCRSLRRFLPGWAAWDVDPADARRMRVEPYWDAAAERWLPVVNSADGRPLTIRRTLSPVSAANDGLELTFAQFKNTAAAADRALC